MKNGSVEFEIDRVTFLARQKRFIVDLRITAPFRTMQYADFVGDEVPDTLQDAIQAWLSTIETSQQVIDATNPLK